MTTDRPLDLDRLTLEEVRGGILRDRPVTVLGFARSGIALARFLVDGGAVVTIYDGRPASELSDAMDQLDGRTVRLLAGPAVMPETAWDGVALVTTSPSINADYPTTEPRLRTALRGLVEARARGDRSAPALVSEPDLFLRLCPAPTIGVTGTKGKTTTASLVAAVLAADPAHPVVLGGNIGIPLIERLPELTAGHRVVIELSELQLPTLSRGTTVAVFTNVTSDHLDRHGSLDDYRTAKLRIFENQEETDGAVVPRGFDDVPGQARRIEFDPSDELPAEPLIPGAHNRENAAAATAAARALGISDARIAEALETFPGVAHRLEPVAEIGGVRFVNDSKATNTAAARRAVAAYDAPLHVILGGQGKGESYTELALDMAGRTRRAYLIGDEAAALAVALELAGVDHEVSGDLETAVRSAARNAQPGEIILLAPACASYDQFHDFEERGDAFRRLVEEVAT